MQRVVFELAQGTHTFEVGFMSGWIVCAPFFLVQQLLRVPIGRYIQSFVWPTKTKKKEAKTQQHCSIVVTVFIMSKQFKAVFAEETVLQRHLCKRITSGNGGGSGGADVLIHPSGWKFASFHGKIPNESETESLARSLKLSLFSQHQSLQNELVTEVQKETFLSSDSININHFKLRIPPMIFVNDIMRLTHIRGDIESAVSINAEDALLCWMNQVSSLSFQAL